MASAGQRNSSPSNGQRSNTIITFILWCVCIILGVIALTYLAPIIFLAIGFIVALFFGIFVAAIALFDTLVRKGRVFFTPKRKTARVA